MMTAPTLDRLDTTAAGAARRSQFRSGVRTVARLELRRRVRSRRWMIVLGVWTAVLAASYGLVHWAVFRSYHSNADWQPTSTGVETLQRLEAGRLIFAITVFLVLSLSILVVPTLSATSINGDRAAGVLATLQTTLLTPAQIVLGKLLAAWTAALALLGCALPFVLVAFFLGGTPFGRLLAVLAVLAATLLVMCAIGLGWSAIAARTSSSTLLTYLCVTFLGLGLPLLFVVTAPPATTQDTVTVRNLTYDEANPDTIGRCVTTQEKMPVFHTERTWWLLAASPYVIVADAAPRPSAGSETQHDPLSSIRDAVRAARFGPAGVQDYCSPVYLDGLASNGLLDLTWQNRRAGQEEQPTMTWPYGLAALLLLGGGFTTIAMWRLRAPARRLPRGTRVA